MTAPEAEPGFARDRRRGLALAQRGRRARDAAHRPVRGPSRTRPASRARCSSASATTTRPRRRSPRSRWRRTRRAARSCATRSATSTSTSGDAFERAIEDQVAFLQRVARAASSPRSARVALSDGLARRHRGRRLRRLLRRAHARAGAAARRARASRSSTTSTSCSTRRCCPGAAAGTLEPRHVVVPLREELRRTDLRLGHGHRRRPGPRRLRIAQSTASGDRGARLRPADRRARLGLAHAADPRPRRARDRASRRCPTRSRCATACCARSRSAETVEDPAERAAWLTLRVRRRRLRGARGPRRAAGLRRRRDRALPALPHAGDALDPRRGARPRDARDPAVAREFADARAARARHRDPHEHDARRGHRRRRARLCDGETVPTRTVVWTAGVRPHPVVARARPAARRSGGRHRASTARCACAGRDERLGDRRRRRGARPGAARAAVARRPPSTRSARAAASRATSPRRSAAAGARRSRYKTLGVFVDMGQREAVASTLGIKWRGAPAWLLARTYHLAMMPGSSASCAC